MKVLPTESLLSASIIKVLTEARRPLKIAEIEERVRLLLGIADEEASTTTESSKRSELTYRLAWCRTRMKKNGEIIRVSHGVWTLSNNSVEKTPL
jgi:restriction system protein